MATLLVTNGTVVTLGAENRVLEDHEILCSDGRVVAIAPSGSSARADRALDARGGLILPGFVNAHMHFYSTLVRGLGKAEPSSDFRDVLEHLWWRLDRVLSPEDCHLSALLACLDAIRHGTTTLIDHHASPGAVSGSLDEVARAVEATGLRAALCYETSDRDGQVVADSGLAENERFARRCAAEPGLLRAMVGLHASFTLSDATLDRAAALAEDLGVGCHVHVAEAESDQQACLAEHGLRVVERLARARVLGPRSIAAHCVHVDAHERELLASSATAVVHNPQSNMNNAVGVADVLALLGAGCLVGLGTDAMTVDMREELRAALWLRHLAERNPSVGFCETTGLLISGSPAIASRLWPEGVGVLRPGAAADVIVVDYRPPTPLDAGTFLGHLVFGLQLAEVRSTVVAGRVLMADRRLELDIDENEVAARAREAATRLWERF